MANWFRYKNYPDFWNEYLKKFKGIQPKTIESTRFIVFDTETTGFNSNTDKILSIGAIGISNNIIDVSDCFEVYLKQSEFNVETVEIHGILRDGNLIKSPENEAIETFVTI